MSSGAGDIDEKHKKVEGKLMAIPDKVALHQTQPPSKTHTITARASYTIRNDFMPEFGISVYQKYHLTMTVSL